MTVMCPRVLAGSTLLVALACATAPRTHSQGRVEWYQADEQFPSSVVFDDERARAAFNEGRFLEADADSVARRGDAPAAQAQFGRAARAYLSFVEQYPGSGWDLKIRYHAARLLAAAKQTAEAAAVARQVATDPHGTPKTRAMALLLATNALADAGKVEPLRMVYANQRNGRPASPRTLPPQWQEFADATDAYLATLGQDRTGPQEGIVTAPQLAVVAAQAEFAADRMEDARRRFASILKTWAGIPEVFRSAARPYVETFLVSSDREGAIAGARWVDELAGAQLREAPNPDVRKLYESVAADVRTIQADLEFQSAKALLATDPTAAARTFETVASIPGADAAAALNGAAIAWDRAGDANRAAALRERVLHEHADSWVAPDVTLQLAAHLAKERKHLEAARLYADHARRWPDDPNRCTALRNGAVELDLGDRGAEAAELYRAFGTDPRCLEKSPNAAALALHRAGKQFLAANRPGDARDAFRRATAVQGVTSADAKGRVAESKRLLQRLGRGQGDRR